MLKNVTKCNKTVVNFIYISEKQKYMRSRFSIIAIIFSFCNVLSAQYNYTFTSPNYDRDTLIIGYYSGDKTLVKDTLYKDSKGKFLMSGSDKINPGLYIGLLKPDNNIFQFVINNESKFEIKFDTAQLNKIEPTHSQENKLFFDYIAYINQQRGRIEPLNTLVKNNEGVQGKELQVNKYKNQIEEINQEVKSEQKRISTSFPQSFTSFLVKATNDDIQFPAELEKDESEEGKVKKYLYYKSRFFDGIDFKNPMLINNNFFHSKVTNYFDRLVSPLSDSIIVEIDRFLPAMQGNEEAVKYFLSSWISKYGNAKIIGHDAVYVHLMDNYFKKGWAPWSDPEKMKTLYKYADEWRPILIGKQMPKIETYKKTFNANGTVDSSLVKIYDVKAPYTVAIFWASDCGHCSKVMPSLVSWEEKYRHLGVKVFAVCANAYDKENACWPAVKEKKMDNFINTSDYYQTYRRVISIPSTPQIFILDENKKILLKGFDVLKIEEIFEEILKSRSSKS